MPKKIKNRPTLTREEREAERKAKEEERSRQEAGIQDEFQAKGFEFVDWIQGQRHKVMAGLGGIVAIGLMYSGVEWSKVNKNSAASEQYVEAHEAFSATLGGAPAAVTGGSSEDDKKYDFTNATERATKARTLFQQVVDDSGASNVGALASLYIGQTSLTLNEHDKAIAAYQSYIDNTASTDPLRFVALEGLATALIDKGDTKGAIEQLQALVALPGKANKDLALLRLARLYNESGDTAKAKEVAQRLVNEFETSPLKSEAEELIGSDKQAS